MAFTQLLDVEAAPDVGPGWTKQITKKDNLVKMTLTKFWDPEGVEFSYGEVKKLMAGNAQKAKRADKRKSGPSALELPPQLKQQAMEQGRQVVGLNTQLQQRARLEAELRRELRARSGQVVELRARLALAEEPKARSAEEEANSAELQREVKKLRELAGRPSLGIKEAVREYTRLLEAGQTTLPTTPPTTIPATTGHNGGSYDWNTVAPVRLTNYEEVDRNCPRWDRGEQRSGDRLRLAGRLGNNNRDRGDDNRRGGGLGGGNRGRGAWQGSNGGGRGTGNGYGYNNWRSGEPGGRGGRRDNRH